MASQFPPGAIFSPSQARQQLAQAKDWNYVDTWLSTHYSGRPAPPFERNPETLKALLALAAHNEAADEERDLLQKLESKALQQLQTEVRHRRNVPIKKKNPPSTDTCRLPPILTLNYFRH
jgi:HAUS augmin-like complex subunit 1